MHSRRLDQERDSAYKHSKWLLAKMSLSKERRQPQTGKTRYQCHLIGFERHNRMKEGLQFFPKPNITQDLASKNIHAKF